MTQNRMSALVVGAGVMGRWHVHELRRLGVAVVGIVDPDVGRAAGLARGAGRCPAYSSVGEALAVASPTAAHVCTPLESHVAIVAEVLAAGVHVLAEKPLAADAEATRALTSTARVKGRIVCPVHQFLFQRGFLRCLRWLDDAGAILHVDMVAVSAGAASSDAARSEEVVADILPHPLSLMRRVLGSDFASSRWDRAHGPPGELRAAGSCGATTLGILVSMAGRPTRNGLRIICERGSFHADLFHGHAVREPPAVSRRRKLTRPFTLSASTVRSAAANLSLRAIRREPAYPGLRELIRRFYDAVSGGVPPISTDEIIDVAVLRDRLLASRS